MESLQYGDGHIVVVEAVRYREPVGRIRLPHPALIADESAIARLGRTGSRSGLFPRTLAIGVADRRVGPAVSFDGSADWIGATDPKPTAPGESSRDSGSFALGLHAASVGTGDPLSPSSLVGARVLAPGEYREVPVPIWPANPFPIEAPGRPDGLDRADRTPIELALARGEAQALELTATLWRRIGADAERSRPVRTGAERPVTDRATVTFEPAAGPTMRDTGVVR